MKRNLLLGLVVLGVLALSAYSTGPGTVYPDRDLLPIGGESNPVHTSSLLLGQTDYFSIRNDAGTGDYDLLVIELDEDLTLELTTRSGTNVYLVSDGPTAFGEPAGAGVGSVGYSGALDPSAITIDPPLCRGSCIVLPARNQLLHFQVRGATLPTDYSVYTYVASYSDSNEPLNDYQSTPAPYVLGSDDGGAIETVGDVDWWRVTTRDPLDEQTGSIEFYAPNDQLDIRLYVYDGGVVRDDYYTSGDMVEIHRNSLLQVRSGTGRAARGAPGYYYFEPVLLLGPVNQAP